MVDTTTAVAPAVRSPGHGAWAKLNGPNYQATSMAFLFGPTGVWVGTQTITQHIQMNGRDAWTSTAVSEVVDTQGNVLPATCATAVGDRLLVNP